jgi:hypothetical protein
LHCSADQRFFMQNTTRQKGVSMYQICVQIGGKKHCFPLAEMIDKSVIKRPPPNNLPPFELAVAVLTLVDTVPASDFSKELTQVATRFIQSVQKDLPKGVELVEAKAQHKTA